MSMTTVERLVAKLHRRRDELEWRAGTAEASFNRHHGGTAYNMAEYVRHHERELQREDCTQRERRCAWLETARENLTAYLASATYRRAVDRVTAAKERLAAWPLEDGEGAELVAQLRAACGGMFATPPDAQAILDAAARVGTAPLAPSAPQEGAEGAE